MDYFDHAASSIPSERVLLSMQPWLKEEFGNPSSRHRPGVRAAVALDEARTRVARALRARERDVVFTAGGTEANNLAVLGAARARRREGRHILLGPSEHPSVRGPGLSLREEGFEVEFLRLDESGALDLAHAQSRLRADTVLVAQMIVQNEVGTIYPVAKLAQLVRSRSPLAHLHVDAVQALGKLELTFAATGADSLAISAHKIHGPKGAGALILRGEVRLTPLVFGGGQERGLRSGTENVAAIVGLGVACEEGVEQLEPNLAKLWELRTRFVQALPKAAGLRCLEPGRAAGGISPAIVALLVPGSPAEVWQHHLEEQGLFAGTGSACQSNKKDLSPTFAALGLKERDARALLRFSFAPTSSVEQVERAARLLAHAAEKLASLRVP